MSKDPTPATARPSTEAVRDIIAEFAAEKQQERVEEQRAAAKRNTRRWIGTALMVAITIATWTVPVGSVGAEGVEVPPGMTVASARMTLGLAASRINQFRETHGRLPSTLEDAGVEEEGMVFTRVGDQAFALQLGVHAFDSSMEPATLLDAAAPVVARFGR